MLICLIYHTYKHAVLSIVEIHVVASYYRQEKHLEEVEQCTRTHAALISSMKTRGDLENIFIHDMSWALPINRSAAEVETSIFTSFKGVPVWYAYNSHVRHPESALHFINYKQWFIKFLFKCISNFVTIKIKLLIIIKMLILNVPRMVVEMPY